MQETISSQLLEVYKIPQIIWNRPQLQRWEWVQEKKMFIFLQDMEASRLNKLKLVRVRDSLIHQLPTFYLKIVSISTRDPLLVWFQLLSIRPKLGFGTNSEIETNAQFQYWSRSFFCFKNYLRIFFVIWSRFWADDMNRPGYEFWKTWNWPQINKNNLKFFKFWL